MRFQLFPKALGLVVTDLTMPELTGVELAKVMLKLRPDLPIILCTGDISALDKEAVYAIGIQILAARPIDKRTLGQSEEC